MSVSVDQRNKERIWDLWQRLDQAGPDDLRDLLAPTTHPDITWFGPHPINELEGLDEVVAGYWEPLMTSFAGLRRRCHVFLADESRGEHWVSACGYFTGTFVRDWLGIPATGRPAHVHFGEHCRLEDDQVVESYLILDVPSVMRQAGYQMLPPSRGAEGGRVIAPPRGEGVLLTEQDDVESRQTRQLVWAMIRAIEQAVPVPNDLFWHRDMHWYGPTGIGSCYGIDQYEEFHAGPWSRAFPDPTPVSGRARSIGVDEGEILAEGNYAALGIWDAKFSVHRGEYLGVPATGKLISMRDFDWYRRDGRYLVQNWVPIDLIDILRQLDVDVMQRLAHERERREAGEPAGP